MEPGIVGHEGRMTRDDYRKSPQFKDAVRRIYIRLLAISILVSAFIGWFFHDIIATIRSPIVSITVGEFTGVFILVYVTANLILHWLTSGSRRR
jgi:hypothetical protein